MYSKSCNSLTFCLLNKIEYKVINKLKNIK